MLLANQSHFINLTNLNWINNRVDNLKCLIDTSLLNTAYCNGSIIIDINLDASLFNNRIDCLTTLSNNLTNFLWINL